MPDSQQPAGDDLRQTITALNREAYALAQQVARHQAQTDQYTEQARALDQRLEAVSPLIDSAEAWEQGELAEAWTDARLDLDYILSGGSQPTSIRLHHYLAGLGQEPTTP